MRDPSVRYQICLLGRVLSQTIMNTPRSALQSRYCNNILVFTKHIDTIYSIISHFPTTLQDTCNICNSEHLILRYRHKFLRYSVDGLGDVFNVDFISKFSLSVLQKYSLARGKNKLFWSVLNDLKPETTQVHSFYLLFTPDDKDAPEDEAFTENVAHEAAPEGPEAVHPHSDPQEAQKTHLALTGPIKTPLSTEINRSNPSKQAHTDRTRPPVCTRMLGGNRPSRPRRSPPGSTV